MSDSGLLRELLVVLRFIYSFESPWSFRGLFSYAQETKTDGTSIARDVPSEHILEVFKWKHQ